MILIESSFIDTTVSIVDETPQNLIIIESNFIGGSGGGGTWGSITGNISDQTDLQNELDAKVPYTGATGNVTLGEYGLSGGYSQFDTTPTQAGGVGRLIWNDTDGTLDLGLKGGNVTLQVGQEQVVRVVNKTGSTLQESAYQVVRVSTAQGQRLGVALAQANNDNNSADTLGIVTETILNNEEGFITVSGLVNGINTTGSLQSETWTDGDVLYLSGTTAGAITNVKPSAPTHLVKVGYVVYAHANNGKIFVDVLNGFELDELHDVSITSPTNGQVLKYNSTTSLWENATDSGGITTLNTLTALTQTFATGTSGSDFNISSSTSTHTFNIPTASITNRGLLSSSDWAIFNNKQNALTNPITGTGTSGQIAYWSGTNTQTGSSTLTYSPTAQLLVNNTVTAASAIARGINFTPTLIAAANNDVLVAHDINAAFTNGAFTGVRNLGLRVLNNVAFGTLGTGLYWDNTNARLGIGTSSPSFKFQIEGSESSVLSMRLINNAIATGNKYCNWFLGGPSTGVTQWNNSTVIESAAGSGSNFIFSNYEGAIYFQTGASRTTRVFIANSTNAVGINITNPQYALDVGGGIRTNNHFRVSGTGSNTIVSGPYMSYEGTGTDITILQQGSGRWSIWSYNATWAESLSVFQSTRNVTIGTTTDSGFRLDISGTLRSQGNVTFSDTVNLIVGSTTGTKIATATSQKLGFWNATPIVQPTTAVAAATFVANTSGIANDTATFDGYTIGQVVKALRNAGILA